MMDLTSRNLPMIESSEPFQAASFDLILSTSSCKYKAFGLPLKMEHQGK